MNISPKYKDIKGNYYKVLDSFYTYAGDEDDKYVQHCFRTQGVWDDELTNFMIQNIKPGWKCLDIGSNTGYFAEVMARLAGPTGSVIAFEPIKRLVDAYEEGRKLNDYTDVAPIVMHNFGLSNETKDTNIHILPFNIGGSRISDEPGSGVYENGTKYLSETVHVKALKEIYDETPDFIKIDIENHEKFAFEGFSENTLRCPLIVIELGQEQPVSFLNYINKNYDLTYVSGVKAYTYDIIGHDVINIVMRKK